VTGSVEPHYFAGFTGGRKAFLPGIAGYETIVANHKLAVNDAARSLALEGNPVHEDMMDALSHIKAPVFSLMTVLDKEQNVVAATGGDIVESFKKAVAIARRVFCVPISRKADIVVSIAKFPMDINLYQSQKAIDNGALAVKDGGTLILVSACREGIGDQEFADLLGSCSSPDQALQVIEKTYKLGYHKAAKMASVCKRMKVLAYTKLTDCQVASLFLEPVSDLQAALDGAIAEAKAKGIEKPSIILLPDGCVTVPSL
jgi:nickel-dependent lactate racemase